MPDRRTVFSFTSALAIISAILAVATYHARTEDSSAPTRAAPTTNSLHYVLPTYAAADSVRVPGVQMSPEHRAATGAGVEKIAPDPAAQLARDLTSSDESVRQQALFAAVGSGDPQPVHTLEQMLSYDPSELVRRLALEALSVHPEVDPGMLHTLLVRASTDPSPLVRESAAAIAETLAPPADTPADYGQANTTASGAADLIRDPDTGEPASAIQ